uniref:tumor protein D53 isoform X3 n=1 Tax=Centroberyx gerrardi TaxID=166262 RepID=UPI003AAA99BF
MGRAKPGMEDDRPVVYDCKMPSFISSFDEGKVKLSRNLPTETSLADSKVERSVRDLDHYVTRSNSALSLNGDERDSEEDDEEEERSGEEEKDAESNNNNNSNGGEGERRRRASAVEILRRNFGTTVSKSSSLRLNTNSRVQYNADNENDEGNANLTTDQGTGCGDYETGEEETKNERPSNRQVELTASDLRGVEFLNASRNRHHSCAGNSNKITVDESFRAKEHVYCTVYCIANDNYRRDVEIIEHYDETPAALVSDEEELEMGQSTDSSPEPEPYTLGDLVDPRGVLGRRLSREQAVVWAALQCCRVCLEEKTIAPLHCCRKAVCDECLKLYVSSQVRVGRAYISCPIPECSGFLEEGVVISHLANEDVAKYRYFVELSQLDSSTKPCPQCSQFTSLKTNNPNRTEHKYKIQCSKCQFVWCFKCHAPWHNGLKCRDYRRGDKLLRNWASVIEHGQRNAQKCPECKIHIQRTEGCDHMTCTQCNTNFCYRCGERYRHLRFFGDHTSNLSVFGCKYRYLPDKPHLRRLIRGSVCVSKVLIAPLLLLLALVLGALSLVIGLLASEPFREADEDLESEVNLNNSMLTEEEREEIQQELAKLEEEINTLRQVLFSKEKQHSDLKQKLGITPLSEFRNNFSRGWHDMQTSTAYKKTSETLSTAGQKTSAAFSTLGTAITRKFGDMRNSPSFKSFEEKVENTVTNIKTKVGGPGPGGSFEEVLSSTANASSQDTPTNNLTDTSERPC